MVKTEKNRKNSSLIDEKKSSENNGKLKTCAVKLKKVTVPDIHQTEVHLKEKNVPSQNKSNFNSAGKGQKCAVNLNKTVLSDIKHTEIHPKEGSVLLQNKNNVNGAGKRQKCIVKLHKIAVSDINGRKIYQKKNNVSLQTENNLNEVGKSHDEILKNSLNEDEAISSKLVEQQGLVNKIMQEESKTEVPSDESSEARHSYKNAEEKVCTSSPNSSSVAVMDNGSVQPSALHVDRKSSKNGDVYEFLSQSSISEHEDPTSDVVKKLIEEGKASLAKHKKPAGKKKNTKKGTVKMARENIKTSKKIDNIDKFPKTRAKIQPKTVNLNSTEVEILDQSTVDIPNERWNSKALNNLQDAEQSFAGGEINGKQMLQPRKVITDKMKLLEVARNFVNQSTPVNKKRAVEPDNHLSPIYISSPWRPPDERVLPRVFYFSRNEDDLPSYSSDVVPSSQTIRERSSVNLSNIENIAPPAHDIETYGQKLIPSARATMSFRSPLKSINIIDIVELPSRARNINDITKIPTEKTSFNKLSLNNSVQRNVSNAKKTQIFPDIVDVSNVSIENCFGFDDIPEDGNEEINNITPRRNHLKNLKTKLKSLKRLLPPKPTRTSYNTIKSIFSDGPKQKDIREMLTSTILENKNKREANTRPQLEFDESIDLTLDREDQNETDDLHLFDDLDEPKTSFNASAKVKTYTRQPRRRRKLRNDLVLYSDDESEEEEEIEKPQKKKRTKPSDKKADVELNHFVEEFNSMCDEVERYQLQIEKV